MNVAFFRTRNFKNYPSDSLEIQYRNSAGSEEGQYLYENHLIYLPGSACNDTSSLL